MWERHMPRSWWDPHMQTRSGRRLWEAARDMYEIALRNPQYLYRVHVNLVVENWNEHVGANWKTSIMTTLGALEHTELISVSGLLKTEWSVTRYAQLFS